MRRMILLIMTILGVAFLILTVVMFGIFHQQTQGMVPMEGTIESWDQDHPIVTYTVDGQEYIYHPNVSSSVHWHVSSSVHWPVGSPYRLMVNPGAPHLVTDYFLVMMGGIFGLTAIIMLGIGFTIWAVMGRGERRREDILQFGLRATAVIVELKQNRAVQVNNRHPWVAIATCLHPSTREEVTLKSHMLWYPAVAEGDKIDVAFDPMDERRYAMDIPEEKKGATPSSP